MFGAFQYKMVGADFHKSLGNTEEEDGMHQGHFVFSASLYWLFPWFSSTMVGDK